MFSRDQIFLRTEDTQEMLISFRTAYDDMAGRQVRGDAVLAVDEHGAGSRIDLHLDQDFTRADALPVIVERAPARQAVHIRMDLIFFFSSRRRHTRFDCDWSSDVCSSD